MSEKVARHYDLVVGICYRHPPIPTIPYVGVIITGAPSVYTNNKMTARQTDLVQGCHIARIATSSGTVITENLGTARRFDLVTGPPIANIVQGSDDTYSGD
jgi:hypothetical protein